MVSSKSKSAKFKIESYHVQNIINENTNPEISEEDIRNNFFVKVYASKKTAYTNQYSIIQGSAQTTSIFSDVVTESPSIKLDMPESMRMYTLYDIPVERIGDHTNIDGVWVYVKNNVVDLTYKINGITSDQDTWSFNPTNSTNLFIERKPSSVAVADVLKNFYLELELLDHGIEVGTIKTQNFTVLK